MNKCLIIVGVICALLWGFITAMTFGIPERILLIIDRITFHKVSREVHQMANGFYYDVSNNNMPTIAFLFIFGIIFFLVFFLSWKMEKNPPQKHTLGSVILFSILFRLIILPGELIHENDIYRYIWDGKATLHGINPYKYAPADVFMYDYGYVDDYYNEDNETTIKAKTFTESDVQNLEVLVGLRDENPTFYKRIGHWQVPTIYPPMAQILFTLPVLVNSYSIVLMKFFFVVFDIASLFLIIGLLNHFHKNPSMSIIYGWSPLVLFEFSNGGHYDSIPIFLTLMSIFMVVKRRQWGGTCVLALATLSKFFSGVLLPILINPLKKRYVFLFGFIILSLYAPYIIWDQAGVGGVFQGLMTYNRQWSYNSSVFALIYILMENISSDLTHSLLPSKIVAGCLFLIVLAILSIKKNKSDLDVVHKCFLAIAILFIINPVADPWYFCWVVPFLCFFPYKSWYLLSGLLMLGYLKFHTDISIVDVKYWDISLISWITYTPFFICLIFEGFRRPKFDLETSQNK